MRALLIVIMILASFTIHSQRIVKDTILSTGFVTNFNSTYINAGYFADVDINDSLGHIDYAIKKDDSTQIVRRFYFNLNGFNFLSDTTIFSKNDSFIYIYPLGAYYSGFERYLTDESNNQIFYVSKYVDHDKGLNIKVFSLNASIKKDSLVFELSDSLSPFYIGDLIYDSTYYIYSFRENRDTFDLRSYSLAGQLISHNKFYQDSLINPNLSSEFPFHTHYSGPVRVLPNNDSLMAFERISESVQLINRFTLDTAGVVYPDGIQLNQLFASDGWLGMQCYFYEYHPTFIRMGGTINHYPFIKFGSVYKDKNFAYLDMDYNGNIINHKEYGNDSTWALGRAYARNSNWDYFAGSEPYQINHALGQEKRQVLIYRDSSGYVDSLYLFGHKNHDVVSIRVNEKNEMMLITKFSNAWTDDSVYYQVSVFDFNMITSLKEINPKQTSLVVYPNPTQDYLKSDQFAEGLNYQIYNIQGQLVKEGRISSGNEIQVNELGKGSYVLVLLVNELMKPRSIHFIKE